MSTAAQTVKRLSVFEHPLEVLSDPNGDYVSWEDYTALERRVPTWQPIETAPKDGLLFLAYAPGREGLPAMISLCAYHRSAGFCIDELREPTHWMPLPAPPDAGGTR